MLLYVYRMRHGGARVAGSDPALRRAAYGWLEFARSPLDSYGPRWEAHLRIERGGHEDAIPPLHYARVLRVDGVMHLIGRENLGRGNTKAKPVWKQQSWLCAIDPAHAMPLLDKVWLPAPVDGWMSPEDDFVGIDFVLPDL